MRDFWAYDRTGGRYQRAGRGWGREARCLLYRARWKRAPPPAPSGGAACGRPVLPQATPTDPAEAGQAGDDASPGPGVDQASADEPACLARREQLPGPTTAHAIRWVFIGRWAGGVAGAGSGVSRG
jgi:hypothetical protein